MSASNVSTDTNTPSRICLEWDALETKIGTGNATSTTQVAEWNIGADFHTMDNSFNISLDPDAIGVAGTSIDPDEGQTIDVYLVGYSHSAVTGTPNTNGQLNGQHFQITRTNGELEIAFVSRRIEAGHTAANALTDSFNSISTAQVLVGDGGVDLDAFLTGAGFNPIVSAFSGVALLQLDGQYTKDDGTRLTVDEAIAGGYVACEKPDEKFVGPFDDTELLVESVCLEGTLMVVAGQNINDAGPVETSVDVLDIGWTMPASGSLAFSGSPAKVRLSVQAHSTIAQTANLQRPAPVIELYRGNDLITTSATGYIRDSSDHEESSQTVIWTDRNPGLNPIYRIESRQEALAGVVSVISGQFTAEACGAAEGTGGSTTAPTLAAAEGKVTPSNFQDQFGNLNLQIGNTTNAPVNWQALVENVPYPAVTATGNFTIATADNGDGTFNHLFTGAAPLAAFANITITSGPITPAGDGSGLSLYCEAA